MHASGRPLRRPLEQSGQTCSGRTGPWEEAVPLLIAARKSAMRWAQNALPVHGLPTAAPQSPQDRSVARNTRPGSGANRGWPSAKPMPPLSIEST
jgi:hypothetical protein